MHTLVYLFVTHHGNVVQSVKVRQRLQVCLVLNELLRAAVEQAHVGVSSTDHLPDSHRDKTQNNTVGYDEAMVQSISTHLAVEFQYETQDTVGCWMLRSEVDGEVGQLLFRHVI
jgi:hypothetical protein